MDTFGETTLKRSEAVQIGAYHLFTAERAVALAVRETAMLTVTLLDAREQAGLSVMVGKEAFSRLSETTTSLHSSYAAIQAMHSELDEVKTRIGCRTVATGGQDKEDAVTDPMSPFGGSARGRLTVAA